MSGRRGRKVCDFFLRGSCKFGDSCRNEHPRQGTLHDARNQDRSSRGSQPQARGRDTLPYNLSKDAITADLKNEKPIWPFSAYGPGKNAPRQLFEGPIEQSPEEMRVAYYAAQASGNPQQAAQAEQELLAKTQQQVQQALDNVDAAIQYIIDGASQHPNRLDIEQSATAAAATRTPDPFGGQSISQSSFGTPSFGQASTPQPSAFGQQRSNIVANNAAPSAFGQPSAIGSQQQFSAFGKPSLPGGLPAFGNPGLPSNASPFANAASAQHGTKSQSPFAQPSGQSGSLAAFQTNVNPSPFASNMAAPARVSNSSPFASSQPQQNGNPSPFGQQPAIQASAFGPQNGSQASPFGGSQQPSQTAPNGNASESNTVSGPFGQNNTTMSNHLVAQADHGSTRTGTGGLASNGYALNSIAQTSQTDSAGRDPSSYLQYDRNKAVISFKGQRVHYVDQEPHYRRPDTGQESRLWFPDGPPANPNKYGSENEEIYAAAGEALEAAYKHVAETGTFKDGFMPEIAPKAEWIRYDI